MIRPFVTSKRADLEDTKADKLVLNAQILQLQTDVALKAPYLDPVVLNSATLPAATTIGEVSAAEILTLDGVTSGIQGQLNLKAPLASPALTGVPTAPTAAAATSTTQLATTAFVQSATVALNISDIYAFAADQG